MNWRKINKRQSKQPKHGTYKEWKEQLAEEGFYQCVYCAIHDSFLGGIRNFHVEHYKPKSNPRFSHLENIYSNLFYACPICNSFKSNDWPGNPRAKYSVVCYPDPSKVDYSSMFEVDGSLMIIKGKNVASRYLVEKLHLNRTQLILARREHHISERATEIRAASRAFTKALLSDDSYKGRLLLSRLALIMTDFFEFKDKLHTQSPYTMNQTR